MRGYDGYEADNRRNRATSPKRAEERPRTPDRHRIVIVGAGTNGIRTAIKRREAGIEDFVILERAAAVGGTWVNARYPGLACDVPSHLYSFTFEQKPDWKRELAL